MLKVKDVANRLALSASKVYALIESGLLPHHRIGGAIRISEEQLAEFLEATRRESKQSPARKPSATHPKLRHISL